MEQQTLHAAPPIANDKMGTSLMAGVKALAILSWCVLAATGIAHYAAAAGIGDGLIGQLAPSAAFLVLACGLPIITGQAKLSFVGLTTKDVLTGAVVFVAASMIVTRSVLPGVGSIALNLFPATVEETVFRVFLPLTIVHLVTPLRNDAVSFMLAVLLSQVVFAAAHFGLLIETAFPFTEALRLFGGGIFYAVLVDSLGLGVTAALHATMNYTLDRGWNTDPRMSPLQLSFFALLGILLLIRAGTTTKQTRTSTNTTEGV